MNFYKIWTFVDLWIRQRGTTVQVTAADRAVCLKNRAFIIPFLVRLRLRAERLLVPRLQTSLDIMYVSRFWSGEPLPITWVSSVVSLSSEGFCKPTINRSCHLVKGQSWVRTSSLLRRFRTLTGNDPLIVAVRSVVSWRIPVTWSIQHLNKWVRFSYWFFVLFFCSFLFLVQ